MHKTPTVRSSKRNHALWLSLLCLSGLPVHAQLLYWDSNGATAGAGGAAPTGTWGTSTFWSTDPAGGAATAGWTAGQTAVFAAGADATGTYNVTVSGVQAAAGVQIEEGTVHFIQGASSNISIGTGSFTVNPGATLSFANQAVIVAAVGSKLFLDGSTVRNTATGNAGTFYPQNSEIVLGANGGTFNFGTVNILSILQIPTKITGTGAFIKTGQGVLAVASTAGFNTYSGGTIINDGELRVRNAANPFPVTTAVTVNSPGIFNLNAVSQQIGSLTGNGNVGTGSATLTINGSDSTTFTGALKDTANAGAGASTSVGGRLVKNGAGTITFAGLNDITGSTTLTAGGITVAPGAALSAPAATLAVNGGTLTLNNAAQTVSTLTGSGGSIVLGTGHTFTVDPLAASSYAGAISGPGALTKLNVLSGGTNRTLTLSGANTYDGVTTVSGGILQAGSATALGSTVGNTQVAAGAELRVDGVAQTWTTNEAIQIAGTGAGGGGAITVQNSATPTFSGPITLTANATITVSGVSTVTYNNPASFTSTGSSLTLQGGAGVGGGGTISGAIALDTGGLTKLQGGRWILSGANTYTGVTTISAGTLQFAKQAALYNNTPASWTDTNIVVATGGTLALNVGGTDEFTSANVSSLISLGTLTGGFTSGSAVGLDTTNAPGGTFTYGLIANPNGGANALGLTKLGTGTLTLSADNTYTGTTTVLSGTLTEGATGAIADTSNLTVNGATAIFALGTDHSDTVGTVTLQNGGSITGSGTSTLTSTGTFALQNGTVGVILAGANIPLNKTTSGTVTLSAANTYTGATTISAGTLLVNGALNGTLDVTISGTGILGGTGTIAPAADGDITLSGGKISPGTSVGTLTALLSGVGAELNLSAGVTSVNSQALVFELDTPFASDKIVITGGALNIGTAVLEYDDFAFTTLAGFGVGDYVLFDGSSQILGDFGPTISGVLGGLSAELQTADGGNDLILHVAVPEPGTAALLLGGLALLGARRRRTS